MNGFIFCFYNLSVTVLVFVVVIFFLKHRFGSVFDLILDLYSE